MMRAREGGAEEGVHDSLGQFVAYHPAPIATIWQLLCSTIMRAV